MAESITLGAVLGSIQQNLKVPKDRYNEFGKYNFRNAEDILAAVKPLLPKGAYIVTSSYARPFGDFADNLQTTEVPPWAVYQHCDATLSIGSEQISASAEVREAWNQKGMTAPQMSGSAISMAKKYALCNLLGIDDGTDADELESKKGKLATAVLNTAIAAYCEVFGITKDEFNSTLGAEFAKRHPKEIRTQKDVDSFAEELFEKVRKYEQG